MKRLFLALAILTAGTSLFSALHRSTGRRHHQSAIEHQSWLTQTQLLTEIEIRRTELTGRVQELKQNLRNQPGSSTEAILAAVIGTNGPVRLSAEQREKLLAELGFDWKTDGDYLVVSKDALRKVELNAVRDDRLTDAVCDVLAVTPEERAGIEAVLGRTASDYKTWATTHVQRTEPQDNVVAKYTMPVDAEFALNLSSTVSNSVLSALGAERGGMMLRYARSWMNGLGMDTFGSDRRPITLTLTRQSGERSRLGYELRSPASMTSGEVSAPQPFPEAFQAVFPGGWAELARREGFELPKGFEKR